MKVASIQMVSGAHASANLDQARSLLEQAAQAGAELAVLPEYFCLMGQHDSDKLALAEPLGNGPMQSFLADTARALGLWLVAGTLPIAVPGQSRAFNTTLVYGPDGSTAARYDKIHLFRFDNGKEHYDEAVLMAPGRTPTWFDLPSREGHNWRVGLSICYDLRFAELYRTYAAAGANLLLVPAAFTYTTGEQHWEVLLRARAIENLSYVLASAQGGQHENGRRTWGHSMVVDPWGKVLACQDSGVGVVLAELDPLRLSACRSQLPALQHRVL